MAEIEIDGKKITAEPGKMIIQVADEAGIPIPRFCYHPKLSIAANCRMCLVEVVNSGKPLPACATPIADGMKVLTTSAKAKNAQKVVMEFLLINHPLDCPICDQGGQCELQDVALEYGRSDSRFKEKKRTVNDDNLGSLVATEMTRCIHCTRCVRFGEEIAGLRELGVTFRGEDSQIGTYVQHSMRSELSGNIIDLCPVGALTSKPFRFKARAWELDASASIAPHDALGSHIAIHRLRGKVMRVVPRDCEALNQNWLSDRDRFSYEGINSEYRAKKPMMKQNGQWVETDWNTALHAIANHTKDVIDADGPNAIAALTSPSSTLEEMYLLQKLMRSLGSSNIDYRLRQADFRDETLPSVFPIKIKAIAEQKTIFIMGSHLPQEQPLINLRVRQAVLSGANVIVLNPADFDFNYVVAERLIVSPQTILTNLLGIAKALSKKITLDSHLQNMLNDISTNEQHEKIANLLQAQSPTLFLLGSLVAHHPDASLIHYVAKTIAKALGAQNALLTDGANAAGAEMAGCIPHRLPAYQHNPEKGLHAGAFFEKPMSVYFLLNVEPELDCANPHRAKTALQKAFVVSLSPFVTEAMRDYADVILPIGTFAETSGTFVNMEGTHQSFQGAVLPPEEARPAWKVLRVLGNFFELPEFTYESSESVRDQLLQLSQRASHAATVNFLPEAALFHAKKIEWTRLTEWPLYRIDNLVRQSEPLQQSASQSILCVRMNPSDAQKRAFSNGAVLCVTQNGQTCELPLCIDPAIPENTIWVPASYAKTSVLGHSFSAIDVEAKK